MASFEEATAIKAIDAHTYEANFLADWCIGSVPHGGFVTSCIQRAVSLHFSTTLKHLKQPHCLTLHLDFLRRTSIGQATIVIKDTKTGRQTSVVHITLSQVNDDGSPRECIVGYLNHSNLATESGVSLDTKWKLHPPPAPVALAALAKNDDINWVLGQVPFTKFRKASARVNFHFPRRGQHERSITDEWLCFSDGSKFTSDSLGYVVDMFPQIVEAWRTSKENKIEGALWYPTVVLNLDVKKVLPPEGVQWLFVRVRAKQILNGRLDLEIVVLDEGGDLVALSHHVSMVVPADRNLAKRNGKPKEAGKL